MTEFVPPPMMSTTMADFTWPMPYKQEKAFKPISALADANDKEPDVNFETLAFRLPGKHVPLSQFIWPHEVHGHVPQAPVVVEEPIVIPFERIRVPKICHAPAGSMDEAAELLGGDDDTFEQMKQFTYSTTWGKAAAEAVPECKPTPHPDMPDSVFEPTPTPWKAAKVPPICPPPNSCDRFEMKHLDDFYSDRSKKKPAPVLSDPLDELVSKETVAEFARLIKIGRLNYAYDVPHPTYTGHFPRSPVALAMESRQVPLVSPLLSANEAFLRGTVAANTCPSPESNN